MTVPLLTLGAALMRRKAEGWAALPLNYYHLYSCYLLMYEINETLHIGPVIRRTSSSGVGSLWSRWWHHRDYLKFETSSQMQPLVCLISRNYQMLWFAGIIKSSTLFSLKSVLSIKCVSSYLSVLWHQTAPSDCSAQMIQKEKRNEPIVHLNILLNKYCKFPLNTFPIFFKKLPNFYVMVNVVLYLKM